MKISIAVPSFNYARYLAACLQSIATQHYVDLEVLIADGGSTDDSLHIATRYAQGDPRFRVVSTSDRGQAHAVQLAFEQATGDVFCFLNADDLYLRADALSLVAATFEDAAVDLVSFGGDYVDTDGRVIRPIRLRRHPLDSLQRIHLRSSVLQPGTFWRRHVQQEVPFHTEFAYAFDAVFFYEAARRFRWVEYETPIVGYRLHGANKSVGMRPDRIRELAAFEALKFGDRSFRSRYLETVAGVIERLGDAPPERGVKQLIRVAVNGLSYTTAHRLPGI